ncbi:DUF4292 domain-containing protein [Flavobacterium sp. xlx-214]|uniref:DUF4292 domain-containing protein n=1 Tax=unclassified Flavobacterium TaxID=196869 RepID=UPI0013D7083F|nr:MULTISPECIES: DUF4292 domain-containing protein [unclassified Flavobacterium]MBA5792160.1 DUF4292 domain-containing protein [Flavobacterium sp. xlx-221]QMI84405.1 DUF4292 domain-containing protein [Flavobacterium sp. xlx-214]
MKQLFIILALGTFFVSCKSSKKNTNPTENKTEELLVDDKPVETTKPKVKENTKDANKIAVNELATEHYALFENFNTLNIVSEVEYDDGSIDHSIKADIKMQKDKQILITARVLFFTAKVYLTPDRASFYETFNNTHYDGDFKFLSNFLGTDVTYENVENLLLGKAFYNLNMYDYKKVQNNELELKLNQFLMKLVLGSKNQIASTEITQNKSADKLVIQYPSYQSSDKIYLPKEIKIHAMQKKDVKINLDYKKVSVNQSIDFKYKIPDNSKAIKI